MRYIITTARGAESIASEELSQITKDFSKIENFFFCDIDEPEKLKRIRSAYNVIKVLSTSKDFEELFGYEEADEEKNVKSFYCTAPREIKEDLITRLSAKKFLKFSHPDLFYFLFRIKGIYYLGIDKFGDLSKRDYRIFTTRFSLKAPIAYALGAFDITSDKNSIPKKTAIIISTDGSEAIEFMLKFPETECFGYCIDQNLMKGAMKNIIVAGLREKIKLFPSIDIEEKNFDRIIFPLNYHKTLKGKDSFSLLEQIRKQNVLAKDGVISVLALPEIADKIESKIKPKKKQEIWMGSNKLFLMLIE